MGYIARIGLGSDIQIDEAIMVLQTRPRDNVPVFL
jgi:hypothetical protein